MPTDLGAAADPAREIWEISGPKRDNQTLRVSISLAFAREYFTRTNTASTAHSLLPFAIKTPCSQTVFPTSVSLIQL